MVKQISYQKNGPPLYARISSGYAQPGSYIYKLWESGKNVLVDNKEGNFLNPMDDIFPLPTPSNANDGRIVQFITTLAITPPLNDYKIMLEILQGDQTIGIEEFASRQDSGFVTINLFVKLMAE